jgi:hypothetical protein
VPPNSVRPLPFVWDCKGRKLFLICKKKIIFFYLFLNPLISLSFPVSSISRVPSRTECKGSNLFDRSKKKMKIFYGLPKHFHIPPVIPFQLSPFPPKRSAKVGNFPRPAIPGAIFFNVQSARPCITARKIRNGTPSVRERPLKAATGPFRGRDDIWQDMTWSAGNLYVCRI